MLKYTRKRNVGKIVALLAILVALVVGWYLEPGKKIFAILLGIALVSPCLVYEAVWVYRESLLKSLLGSTPYNISRSERRGWYEFQQRSVDELLASLASSLHGACERKHNVIESAGSTATDWFTAMEEVRSRKRIFNKIYRTFRQFNFELRGSCMDYLPRHIQYRKGVDPEDYI